MLLQADQGTGGGSGGSLIEGSAGTGAPTQTGSTGNVAGTGNPVQVTNPATGNTAPGGDGNPGGVNPPAQTLGIYQPFTVPEGVSLDETTANDLEVLGKELNLTQEQMQKFVNLGVSRYTDGQEALRIQVLKEIKDKFGEWESASMSDEEIKPFLNSGGKLPKVHEFINRAMGNADDTQEFLDMAAETGIGFNPLFIKFCIRAGKLMGEAPFLEASRGGNRPASMLNFEQQADAMFGKTM